MGRGRWTQDEQGVRAISINLREPVQPWRPQCPVIDSRGLRHGCPGLESWLTDPFSATRSLRLVAPLATTHPLVCGVSCWYLNTLKSVPLWAWHASPPHLGPCPSGASSSFAIHLSASTCRDQSLQPPSDSLFMNIPFLFRKAGPTSQGLHGAGRRVKPWVFGAMPGPEVTLNRWGGRSACRGGLGTPCRGQGVGVLQREPRASWPKCHPEQLRLYANGGSREGLTGRGSAGFHELLTNNPGTPAGRHP